MKKVLLETICALFIALFIYAAITKLMDVERFIVHIGRSPLLADFSDAVAWGIPVVELLIALLLTSKRFILTGLYAAFGLMVIFTAYIIAILQFSEKIPCSCGGILEKMGWTEHLFFNISFVALAFIGIMLYSTIAKQIRWPRPND